MTALDPVAGAGRILGIETSCDETAAAIVQRGTSVLSSVVAHVVPGGRIVTGFRTGGSYPLDRFDADIARLGLRLEHRFATWDLVPWDGTGDFAVTVLRTPT